MTAESQVELFILKCAALKIAADEVNPTKALVDTSAPDEATIKSSISQFSAEVRTSAVMMAEHYKLFYMLENDIRKLIDETMTLEHGPDWWEERSPPSAKEECKTNQQREQEAGFTPRSD